MRYVLKIPTKEAETVYPQGGPNRIQSSTGLNSQNPTRGLLPPVEPGGVTQTKTKARAEYSERRKMGTGNWISGRWDGHVTHCLFANSLACSINRGTECGLRKQNQDQTTNQEVKHSTKDRAQGADRIKKQEDNLGKDAIATRRGALHHALRSQFGSCIKLARTLLPVCRSG